MKNFLKQYFPLILLFLLAYIPKLFFIGSRDISIDEPFTIFHAQKNLADILYLSSENVHPPTFMMLLHYWMELWGNSPYAVRILPLTFNALSVVYIFLAGKQVFSKPVAWFASGLFLFSTYHFYFGLETRAYALLCLTAISSYYYFNLLAQNPSKKNALFLLLSNVLLVYSHYFGWFVVFVQFVSVLLLLKNKSLIKKWALIFAGSLLAFLPLAWVFIRHLLKSSEGTWVNPPAPMDYFNMLHYFLNDISPIFALALLVGIVLYYKGKREKNKDAKNLFILFIWWFIPYTTMFLVSQKMPMFINRYVLFNSLPFYLFLSASIWVLYRSKIKTYHVVSLLLLMAMLIKLEINSKTFYYREVKNAVEKVKKEQTKNSIVIVHPHWAHLGFMYYYNREIFSQPYTYDSLMPLNNVHPVWNVNMAKDRIRENPEHKVVYYQDGSLFAEPENKIYHYLNSNFYKNDSVFYPQCFYVSSFTPLK